MNQVNTAKAPLTGPFGYIGAVYREGAPETFTCYCLVVGDEHHMGFPTVEAARVRAREMGIEHTMVLSSVDNYLSDLAIAGERLPKPGAHLKIVEN